MKNDYKLVCLDLDGTLLTSERKIDEETLMYLRKLSEEGIHIAIATGRAAFDAKYHAKLINDNTYFICSNGSAGGFTKSRKLLFEECFDEQALEELCAVADKHKIRPIMYTKNYIICTGLKELIMHHYFMFKSGSKRRNSLKYVRGTKGFLKLYKKKNLKIQKSIFFIFDKELMSTVNNCLPNEFYEKAQTSKECFEISKRGVNKSFAVKKLAEKLNVKPEEIIAFGDSENDREMLKFVGKGVAMWNASKAIRDIADEITESHDEQGIYIKLKEIFNI